MANFFYIYEESGIYRRLKGMYVTQAKADSEAAGDVSLTANQGAVDRFLTIYLLDGYGIQAILCGLRVK